MREVQNGLGQIRGLDDAAHLDGALVFDEFADEEEKLGGELVGLVSISYQLFEDWNGGPKTYLRVPTVLPCNQTDQSAQHASRIVALLVQFEKPAHGLG